MVLATTPLPQRIVYAQTLNDYLSMAAANNPMLQARYQEYLAALEKIPQARALPDPELTINTFVSHNGLYMDRFMGQQLSEISLMQMLPWSGLRQAAQHEATYMSQMKLEAYIEARNNLFHEVRTLWYQLYENDRQLKLLEEERLILLAFEKLAFTRYKASAGTAAQPSATGRMKESTGPSLPAGGMNMGNTSTGTMAEAPAENMISMQPSAGSLADVLRIQLQIKELDAQAARLKNKHQQLTARFVNLLNTDLQESLVLADTLTEPVLPASIQMMRDSLIGRHPMIKMNRLEEQVRSTQIRMNQLMGRPMIGVGLAYMIFRPRMDEALNMPMGGENMFMPMVTLSLPVYRKKYQSLKNEATLLQSAAGSTVAATQLNLENELEQLINAWEDNKQTLQLLNDQIALTQHMLRLLTTAYETGTGKIEDLLLQRQALLNYKKERLSTLTNQHILVSAFYNLTNFTTN
jgi:outer membrane protein TolC